MGHRKCLGSSGGTISKCKSGVPSVNDHDHDDDTATLPSAPDEGWITPRAAHRSGWKFLMIKTYEEEEQEDSRVQ